MNVDIENIVVAALPPYVGGDTSGVDHAGTENIEWLPSWRDLAAER